MSMLFTAAWILNDADIYFLFQFKFRRAMFNTSYNKKQRNIQYRPFDRIPNQVSKYLPVLIVYTHGICNI